MRRLVHTANAAREMRERFADKPVEKEIDLGFTWPSQLQHIGDSLAVAYRSDKWREKGDYEDYKHLAESANRAYAEPGTIVHEDRPRASWDVYGEMVSFAELPMPKHVAVLGYFLEANLRLFDESLRPSNQRCVRVSMKHAMLGAAVMPWKKAGKRRKDEPFLFVYTERKGSDPGGVHLLVFGDELGVERDGIVG